MPPSPQRVQLFALICLGGGISLFVIGFFVVPLAINNALDSRTQKLVLSESSELYPSWSRPVETDLRVWHWSLYCGAQNHPCDKHSFPEFPTLRPVGPYVYRSRREKQNIQWNADGTVQYTLHQQIDFMRDLTPADLDPYNDTLYTVNVPLLTAYHQLLPGGNATIIKAVLDTAAKHRGDDNLAEIVGRSPHELLWGWHNKFLEFLNVALANLSHSPVATSFPLYVNNSDNLKKLTIEYTGSKGINMLGKLKQFAGQSMLDNCPGLDYNASGAPCWGSEAANAVTGSPGLIYPPNADNTDIVTYLWDLRRATHQKFQKRVMNPNRIYLSRFQADPREAQSAAQNPENAAYYAFGPNGVYNLSSVLASPLFVSQPRFAGADQSYSQAVDMAAGTEVHPALLDIEHVTGITMGSTKSYQMNMFVTNVTVNKEVLLKLPTLYLPLFMIEENVTYPHDLQEAFKGTLFYGGPIWRDDLRGAFACVGGLLVGIALCAFYVGVYLPSARRKPGTGVLESAYQYGSGLAGPGIGAPLDVN
eukprot:TRINITY_DN1723_c0_g1_i1.p1 TRINITY_DN1723_c0_g1~~TRINITY_DN1723_c0_g1_i1.p1  ORF type:complete len:533 (-),score=94.70 TRINITY_DN1723_c0_g1_i1:227-1825(-)